MAKIKILEDRRKVKRYKLSGGILVHNKVNKAKSGRAIDIGIGGLRVQYDNPKNTAEPWHWSIKNTLLPKYNSYYSISITNNGEGCGLEQVQCKTVGDAGIASTPPVGKGSLRCVKFAPLRHDQIFHLNQLLRKSAVTPVEDRRTIADRRKNVPATFTGDYDRRNWWHDRRVLA